MFAQKHISVPVSCSGASSLPINQVKWTKKSVSPLSLSRLMWWYAKNKERNKDIITRDRLLRLKPVLVQDNDYMVEKTYRYGPSKGPFGLKFALYYMFFMFFMFFGQKRQKKMVKHCFISVMYFNHLKRPPVSHVFYVFCVFRIFF